MRAVKFIKTNYVLIIIIILTGMFDIYKQEMSVLDLRKSVQDLKIIINKNNFYNNNNNKINQPISIMSKEKMLDSIFMLIELSGLSSQLVAIKESAGEMQHAYDVDLTLYGNFLQLTYFLNNLSQQCLPALIRYAEVSKDFKQLKIILKLSIFNYCMKSGGGNVLFLSQHEENDPFEYSFENHSENSLLLFSIKQMKFAGFLRYQDHLAGILSLPNRESKEVVLGEFLGLENAKVVYIDEESVLVQVNQINFQIKKQ